MKLYVCVLVLMSAIGIEAAPYCDAPDAVQAGLRRAAGLWDRPSTQAVRIADTRAILEELVQRYPDDIQANRRFQNDAGISKEELAARYRERMVSRGGDALSTYFYALTLIGRDTSEGIRLFEESLRKDPELAWAHMGLAFVYSSRRFADRGKAREHVDAFFRLCPTSYDFYTNRMLGSYGSPELQKSVAAGLRERVDAEKDAEKFGIYEHLWNLEFRVTPPEKHGEIRNRVREDVERIRRLSPAPTLMRLRLIRDGFRQANDLAGTSAAEEEILHSFAESREAVDIVRERWRKTNPEPQPGDGEEKRLAYAAAQYAATGEWVRRWPWDAISKAERFSAARQLKELSAAELREAMNGLIQFLRGNDVLYGFEPFEHQAAAEYLERGIYIEHVPTLAREGLLVIQARAARETESDLDLPANIERAGAPLRSAAIATIDLMAQAYALLKQPKRAEFLEKELEPLEAHGDYEIGRKMRAASRVAELGGKKLDALAYLEKVLEVEPKAVSDFSKQRVAKITADMRRLWAELGGSEKSWVMRMEAKRGVQEAKTAGGWSAPEKKLGSWELADLGGRRWTSGQLAGKTVLINLWATWCGPCKAEHPYLQKLYERLRGRDDVALVTFNVDDQVGMVQPYMEEGKFTFPVLLAKDLVGGILHAVSIPRNWLVDKRGTHQLEQIGFSQGPDWVERMLGEMEKLK